MRKIITVLLVALSVGVFAQKSKVTSTYNYLKYGELDNAKEAIDLATVNVSTAEWYKTWMYRAQTYARIAQSKDEKYASLKPGALEEAIKAYKKVITIEDKKNPVGQLKQEYSSLVNTAYTEGYNYYNSKDYANTYKYWVMANDINEELGVKDTALVYNIAMVAKAGQMNAEAIAYFDKCITNGFKEALPYSGKARIQNDSKDVDGALATLKQGREKFPNDQSLITLELDIYLSSERLDEALENLNLAINNDPDNYLFYYIRGVIYDNKDDIENAQMDYRKAIELNPEHFDSYLSLGASYNNKGAKMLTEANLIPPSEQEKYDVAKAAAIKVIREGLPYIEKAHELNPKDMDTMKSLKSIYTALNEMEKLIAINKEIQAASAPAPE
ncbi:MAG: hypothetical protein CL840_02410 [Crocinitomicaceae bacterium]|nr:hypothetical protein [Crocinitomicaceae bacterium]|tara:strand:+ start:969 stop:2126 length:1158 start_codon:yes stop_codon:yes gene_type:complete